MRKITTQIILLLLLCLTIISCKLENENSISQTLGLELTSWNLPDEAEVSTPFNLVVSAKTETSCYGKISFLIEDYQGTNRVFAQSFYHETESGCTYLTKIKDSTITLTINQVGKHYFYFPKNSKWNKDSIQIVP